MVIEVTRIGGDGGICRAVVDTAGRDDAARWEQLAQQAALEVPPPYRPQPGQPVYTISAGGHAAQVAEKDLAGPLRELVSAVLATAGLAGRRDVLPGNKPHRAAAAARRRLVRAGTAEPAAGECRQHRPEHRRKRPGFRSYGPGINALVCLDHPGKDVGEPVVRPLARHLARGAVSSLQAAVNADWMVQVEKSVNATWQGAGTTINSADVRWLHAQLELETGELLEPPWPVADRPHAARKAARKWAWESYSPQLTLTIATGVLRDALVGYRELVELNFPNFGAALGLHSVLPVRVDGLVARFDGDTQRPQVEMVVELIQDPSLGTRSIPPVNLQLITDRADESRYEFGQARRRTPRSTFGPRTVQNLPLDLHVTRPATNLAYRWLARDLEAVGWLSDNVRYHD
jgi:hypothetical protein